MTKYDNISRLVLGPAGSGVHPVSAALAAGWGGQVRTLSDPASFLMHDRSAAVAPVIWSVADSRADCPLLHGIMALADQDRHARFLYCRRDPVGFVASRQRRYPSLPFAEHALLWAAAERTARGAVAKLGARLVTIQQDILAVHPERIAATLAEQGMLPAASVEIFVNATRAGRSTRSSLEPDMAPLPLARMCWTADEKAAFQEICAPLIGPGQSLSLHSLPEPLVIDDVLIEREGLLVEHASLDGRRYGGKRIFSLAPTGPEARQGIYLPSVRLGGRNRMRFCCKNSRSDNNARIDGAELRLAIEVCGSIGGKPLLVYADTLTSGQNLAVEATANAANEPVSITLWVVQEATGPGLARLEVSDFRFSAI